MYSNNEIADVLEKAADHIHVHGHHKGKYAKDEVMCAAGAIYYMTGTLLVSLHDSHNTFVSSWLGIKTINCFSKFLRDKNSSNTRIHYWNDAPERTQEEVEDALKNCAKELRNQL